MFNSTRNRFLALVVLNVGFWCVLGFQQSTSGQPDPPKLPFANAVEQRFQTIHELQEIKLLLKQQNELLTSGKLQIMLKTP